VFELSPMGSSWVFTLLYSFSGQQGMNCGPRASLTLDNSGYLYGTNFCDGANNLGNVFKLTNTQNGWQYTSLHENCREKIVQRSSVIRHVVALHSVY